MRRFTAPARCAIAFQIAVLCAGQTEAPYHADSVGPKLPVQRVGGNDLVAIAVYDCPELSGTVRISPEGWIRVPLVKEPIKATGLMPAELERLVSQELRKEGLVLDPVVTVTVAEYWSRPISVGGAVRTPVTFQAIQPTSLLDAITRAGGLSPDAGPEILVSTTQRRGETLVRGETHRVLVRQLLDSSSPEANLELTGGEEVRVPEVGRIYVVGSIKKPGAFPVPGGSDATFLQILALAEGLEGVTGKDAYIFRREAGGTKNEITVPLKNIMDRKSADVPVFAGDIVYVPDSKNKKMSLAALEKVMLFASTAGATALIYGLR